MIDVAEQSTDSDLCLDHSSSRHPLSGADFAKTQRLLYTSHCLSTWNSRAFEFGAFLFLAAIYPRTLSVASLYAMFRAIMAILCSTTLGRVVDGSNRLTVVRASIVLQRLAVALSCTLFLVMAHFPSSFTGGLLRIISLGCLCLLAAMEKIGIILNTVSVERDWVVVIAQEDETRLSTLNSQMRRIDLFCKLFAPLAIAMLNTSSTKVAIIATGGTTVLSVVAEYRAIAKVYSSVEALATPKETSNRSPATTFRARLRLASSGLSGYVLHPAFLPSFALALLYLTVLSFAGQMITYLIAIGISSSAIGILRGVAALFELSATWLAPKTIDRIGPVRAGIWFLNWQMLCVGVACLFFWLDASPTVSAVGTVTAVVASRIGLWGFDLSAQMIIQEEVEESLRGSFTAQEFIFQNLFEMLSFSSTMVFDRPAQFRYPATISAGAVVLAGVLYAAFVRMRRGHLLHLSKCMDRPHRRKQGWSEVAQDVNDSDHELEEVLSG